MSSQGGIWPYSSLFVLTGEVSWEHNGNMKRLRDDGNIWEIKKKKTHQENETPRAVGLEERKKDGGWIKRSARGGDKWRRVWREIDDGSADGRKKHCNCCSLAAAFRYRQIDIFTPLQLYHVNINQTPPPICFPYSVSAPPHHHPLCLKD